MTMVSLNLLELRSTRTSTGYFLPIVDASQPTYSQEFCISSDKYVPHALTYSSSLNATLSSDFVESSYSSCDDSLKNNDASSGELGLFHVGCTSDLDFSGMLSKGTVEKLRQSCLRLD